MEPEQYLERDRRLTPFDIKPGDVVRRTGDPDWKWSPVRPLTQDEVFVESHDIVGFTELLTHFWISHDGGVTWARCAKEITLDYVHELEKNLPPKLRKEYLRRLGVVGGFFDEIFKAVNASAAFRNEALLRTLDTWKESL